MTLREEIENLLNISQKLQREEYDIISGYKHNDDSKTAKWLNDVLLMSSRLPDDNPLKAQIKATYETRRIDRKFPKMCSYLKSLLSNNLLESDNMTNFVKITEEAEQLLEEIIEHKNDDDYWIQRFERASDREDSILRSLFHELIQKKYIDVLFGSGVPTDITINGSGYLYQSRKKRFEDKKLQSKIITQQNSHKEYDVFLSHANKDKLSYVDELYITLDSLGIKIFYDKKEIEWGDNWKQRILNGTAKCEFAIIVISNNFFGREWTEKELNEFLQRQNETGEKIILPLLYEISIEDLITHYPQLEEIQAIKTIDKSKEEIAILLARQLIKRYKGTE